MFILAVDSWSRFCLQLHYNLVEGVLMFYIKSNKFTHIYVAKLLCLLWKQYFKNQQQKTAAVYGNQMTGSLLS